MLSAATIELLTSSFYQKKNFLQVPAALNHSRRQPAFSYK